MKFVTAPRVEKGYPEDHSGLGEAGWNRESGLQGGAVFIAGVQGKGDGGAGKKGKEKTEGGENRWNRGERS